MSGKKKTVLAQKSSKKKKKNPHAHWHNSKYIPVCTIFRSSAYLTTYHMTKEVIVGDHASPNQTERKMLREGPLSRVHTLMLAVKCAQSKMRFVLDICEKCV